MKLRSQKDAIVNGISIVAKVVPSKATMSIPEYILIDASTSEIKPIGNDMELGIEARVEGDILGHGKIALNAKLLSEVTRRLSNESASVIIELDDKFSTTIHCENSVFNIQGRNGEGLAYLPYIEEDRYIYLSQFTLKEIIQQTIFFITPNNSNKVTTGGLPEVNENQLKVISLSGHGISIREVRLKDHYEDTKVVVPGETPSEVSKILGGDNEKEVLICSSIDHILFEFDNAVMVSRLIEGEYFRISQMLSNGYETGISVNKKEFLDCIRRTTILTRENDKRPLIVSIGGSSMELELNSGLDPMDAELMTHKTGKNIMVGFNPKFLIDALHVIDDEGINVCMMNPKSPYSIKNGEESYIYLILPTNFNAATV